MSSAGCHHTRCTLRRLHTSPAHLALQATALAALQGSGRLGYTAPRSASVCKLFTHLQYHPHPLHPPAPPHPPLPTWSNPLVSPPTATTLHLLPNQLKPGHPPPVAWQTTPWPSHIPASSEGLVLGSPLPLLLCRRPPDE